MQSKNAIRQSSSVPLRPLQHILLERHVPDRYLDYDNDGDLADNDIKNDDDDDSTFRHSCQQWARHDNDNDNDNDDDNDDFDDEEMHLPT